MVRHDIRFIVIAIENEGSMNGMNHPAPSGHPSTGGELLRYFGAPLQRVGEFQKSITLVKGT